MELDCYHSSAVCGENLVVFVARVKNFHELSQDDSQECGLLSEEA